MDLTSVDTMALMTAAMTAVATESVMVASKVGTMDVSKVDQRDKIAVSS